MSGVFGLSTRRPATRLYLFGVVPSAPANRFWGFVVAGGLAAVLTAATVGSNTLRGVKAGAFAHGYGGTTWFYLFPAALLWAIYVVLPFFALRGAVRGRILGRSLLTLVAIANLLLLFGRLSPVTWWSGVICTAGFCVAATLGWMLPRSPSLTTPKSPAPSVRRRRFKSAAILFGVAGMVGAHAVYLRRGWQCVLYIGLLFFAYLTADSPVGVVLILVSSAMLFTDFARLDMLIDFANDRSLAKS
jgi:hypothetical protein